MVARIQEIYQSVDNYREAVAQQIAQSSSVEPAVFKARLQEGIGGHSEVIVRKTYFTKVEGRMESLKRRPAEKRKDDTF